MGKNDIAVKQWLSAKDRFADLFNMLIFGGSTVVHPAGFGRYGGRGRYLCS